MSITIADVARRAEVSKTTVSRVLNGKPDVDVATAARVRSVIEELGYVPSSLAVGLARGRTGTVGMLVPFDDPIAPTLNSAWMAQVLQAVAEVLAASAYSLRVFTCNRSDGSFRRFAEQVSAKSVDGLLVVEPEGTLERIIDIQQTGMPVVLINDRDHRSRLPSVATTNREGGQAAARHLMELDRCRPLVITGTPEFGCTQQRLEGFQDVYTHAGRPIASDNIVAGDFRFDGGLYAVRRALGARLEFDSIFAHNDLSAAGAIRALREAGRTKPIDIALVGFDDLSFATQAGHPMTTVRQPLREMGAAAARMLLAHLDGAPLPEEAVVVPTTLVVRSTEITQ